MPQQQPRYVQLPGGSYLEWPQGVSAEEFRAKAAKVIASPPPPAKSTAVDKMFPTPTASAPVTVGQPHPRTGLPGAEDTLGNLRTHLSQFAQKGVGQGAGDFMMSLPLGLLKMAKGGTEIPQGKIARGAGDIVGGGLEAATIPGGFMAPEASEAIGRILPAGRMRQAGELFEQLEKGAGHVPVKTEAAGTTADAIRKLADSGGHEPKVISDFIRRVGDREQSPMTYTDLRRFYTNATRLSADESMKVTPAIKRMVGQFTQELGDAAHAAANSVGMGQKYNDAIRKYRNAAQMLELSKKVLKAVGTAAVGAAAYKTYEGLK